MEPSPEPSPPDPMPRMQLLYFLIKLRPQPKPSGLGHIFEPPMPTAVHAPMQVESFGVGGHVKLPGPSAQEPNVYSFGTPYADIYKDLQKKVRVTEIRARKPP